MKFQCGECKKYFVINNIHNVKHDLEFQCDGCENKFTINRNLVFSSSSGNSQIVCENCGKLIHEKNKSCDSCNLILSKTHEELRIDNKDYELLEIKTDGNIYNSNSLKKLTKNKNILLIMVVLAAIVLIASAGYLLKTKDFQASNSSHSKNVKHTETQIIIMKSGKTYYADRVEKEGRYLIITSKNGVKNKIIGKNVLQLTKAIIEE